MLLEHLAHAGVTRAMPTTIAMPVDNSSRAASPRRSDACSHPALVATERRALLDQLELLELERGESGDGDVPAADAGALSFASLEAVQRALHPREAMLWFSIAAWKDLYDDFGGGAWVVVVTRDASGSIASPTPARPRSQVAALDGSAPTARDTRRCLDGGGAVPGDARCWPAPLRVCPRTSSVW